MSRIAASLAVGAAIACGAGDGTARGGMDGGTASDRLAAGDTHSAGSLAIHGVLAPAPAGDGAAAIAVYFRVRNSGVQADTLDGVEVARGHATLHEQVLTSAGRYVMSPVATSAIPAGETLRFGPGGRHVMVEGLGRAVAPGDTIAMAMAFRHAGRIPVTARVVAYRDLERAIEAGAGEHAGH